MNNKSDISSLMKKLEKYNMVYDIISDSEIQVRIMKNIYIQTVFNENGSITIKDTLRRGNVMSGVVPSSLSKAIIYGSILFIFLCTLSVCHMYLNPNRILLMSMIIFVSAFLFLLFTMHLTLRIESTKRLLIDWIENL